MNGENHIEDITNGDDTFRTDTPLDNTFSAIHQNQDSALKEATFSKMFLKSDAAEKGNLTSRIPLKLELGLEER
jgi:hypothetical protein